MALTYTPIIEKQPSKQMVVSLQDFDDERQNKEEIACSRDLLYIPIYKKKSVQSPKSWISYALESELTNAGYEVDVAGETNKYSITGKIYNLYIDYYLISSVDIKIGFSILEEGNPVFNRIYEFKHKTPISKAVSFDKYLQEICKEFISDADLFFQSASRVEIENLGTETGLSTEQ